MASSKSNVLSSGLISTSFDSLSEEVSDSSVSDEEVDSSLEPSSI